MLNVALTPENVCKAQRLCIKHGLSQTPDLEEYWNQLPPVPTVIDGFNFTLRDYQADAVQWLERMAGTGLLAMEMGLGKTAVVMAYAHRNRKFPMLAVVPDSLKLNWRNEIVAMTGQTYRINVVGENLSKIAAKREREQFPNVVYSQEPVPGCDIYIVNYDILSGMVETLENMQFRYMAVDESHKIKSSESKRTIAVTRLATGMYEQKNAMGKRELTVVGKGIGSTTLLSGTPQLQRPIELWTSLNIVGKWVPDFATFNRFAFRFCGASKHIHGWNFNGVTQASVLHELLTQYVMHRTLKMDVLPELPAQVWSTVPLKFARADYDKVARAFAGTGDWRTGMETIVEFGGNPAKSNETIVAIQKLREIAGRAKIDSAVKWIMDYCEQGDKLVVFAHHREIIEQIKEKLEENSEYTGNVPVIMGGISNLDRDNAVRAFQEDPDVRLIIVSIQAGGYGLTLTAASAAAFIQIPWTPAELQQAASRIHRLGQKANSVNLYNLVAAGTIEEEIAQIIMSKANAMDSVLDGGRAVNSVNLR